MSNDQRSKLYVDPAVQGALSRRLIVHWFVFLMVSASCALMVQFLADPFRPFSTLVSEMWWTQGPILLVGVCLIPIFVMDTIRLSHRFVGPLVRIRSVINQAGRGEHVPPIKLRPNDFWQEFAGEVNIVLEQLNRSRSTTKGSQTGESEDLHELVAT